jgi:lipoprotein-anchoring transpeptidase ErfK/SrfK
MPGSGRVWLLVGLFGLVLGGCTESSRFSSQSLPDNFTARDRELLANPPYAQADIPEQFRRRVVDYPSRDPPGTILVNSDARYLYYVLPDGKAVRYGVAVGNEALAWSGVATVGRMTEWPDWIPTPDIRARLGPFPDRVPGGPANPLGARALYLFQGKTDTLYRIHGTNQPQYIGQAVSSGCIRMTNEDVIDLYDRVKLGATVTVLAPAQGGQSLPAPGQRG